MKNERWQLKIIITHDRTIISEKQRPAAGSCTVAERIAYSPRTRKARAIEAVK